MYPYIFEPFFYITWIYIIKKQIYASILELDNIVVIWLYLRLRNNGTNFFFSIKSCTYYVPKVFG